MLRGPESRSSVQSATKCSFSAVPRRSSEADCGEHNTLPSLPLPPPEKFIPLAKSKQEVFPTPPRQFAVLWSGTDYLSSSVVSELQVLKYSLVGWKQWKMNALLRALCR